MKVGEGLRILDALKMVLNVRSVSLNFKREFHLLVCKTNKKNLLLSKFSRDNNMLVAKNYEKRTSNQH